MIYLEGLTGHDLSITIQTLLAIFGAIAAIMAGLSAIAKMFSPFKELKERVDAHDESLKAGNRHFEKLDVALEEQSQMQREICKSLIVIMNHEVTGNSIDKLKQAQEDLQKFLIDH